MSTTETLAVVQLLIGTLSFVSVLWALLVQLAFRLHRAPIRRLVFFLTIAHVFFSVCVVLKGVADLSARNSQTLNKDHDYAGYCTISVAYHTSMSALLALETGLVTFCIVTLKGGRQVQRNFEHRAWLLLAVCIGLWLAFDGASCPIACAHGWDHEACILRSTVIYSILFLCSLPAATLLGILFREVTSMQALANERLSRVAELNDTCVRGKNETLIIAQYSLVAEHIKPVLYFPLVFLIFITCVFIEAIVSQTVEFGSEASNIIYNVLWTIYPLKGLLHAALFFRSSDARYNGRPSILLPKLWRTITGTSVLVSAQRQVLFFDAESEDPTAAPRKRLRSLMAPRRVSQSSATFSTSDAVSLLGDDDTSSQYHLLSDSPGNS
eukprot:m.303147 g.303147  ORF g.303147 m.303147 type:complete len:382 (-) comp15687_c0_seq1:156-1301(-)